MEKSSKQQKLVSDIPLKITTFFRLNRMQITNCSQTISLFCCPLQRSKYKNTQKLCIFI